MPLSVPRRSAAWTRVFALVVPLVLVLSIRAFAQDAAPPTIESVAADVKARSVEMDTIWTLVTAFLVFWMQAGFAFVETGLTRAKNTVNILMKNMMDFCFATVAFWFIGFGVMFGAGSDWFGTSGFMLHDVGRHVRVARRGRRSAWTQVLLPARLRGNRRHHRLGRHGRADEVLLAISIYSVVISLLIYPVSRATGSGAAARCRRATCSVTARACSISPARPSCTRSAAGLRCAARSCSARASGSTGTDGKVNAIPGHSFGLMILGVFILWLGWFGFNPGSTMMATGMRRHHRAHRRHHERRGRDRHDLRAAHRETLVRQDGTPAWPATAVSPGSWPSPRPCAFVEHAGPPCSSAPSPVCSSSPRWCSSTRVLRIDDPVGATSVHLTNGIWGTLALGPLLEPDLRRHRPAAGPVLRRRHRAALVSARRHRARRRLVPRHRVRALLSASR